MGACFSPLLHGGWWHWVTRLHQTWERSSSRSRVPIAEAPGCPQAPNLHIATQLLKRFNPYAIQDNFFAGNSIKKTDIEILQKEKRKEKNLYLFFKINHMLFILFNQIPLGQFHLICFLLKHPNLLSGEEIGFENLTQQREVTTAHKTTMQALVSRSMVSANQH